MSEEPGWCGLVVGVTRSASRIWGADVTESGKDTGTAARSLHQALVLETEGKQEEALVAAKRALVLFTAAGDQTGEAAAHQFLFMVHAGRGELDRADAHLGESLELREHTKDYEGIASLLGQRFALALQRGDAESARQRQTPQQKATRSQ